MKKLIFISILLIFGCKKEKTCPSTAFLNNYYVSDEAKSWIPYFDYSKVVFTDSIGNEIKFTIDKIDYSLFYALIEASGGWKVLGDCEHNDSYIEYEYRTFLEGIRLTPDSNFYHKAYLSPIAIELRPKLHYEKPAEEKVGDFLRITHQTSVYSPGNLLSHLVDEKTFPTDDKSDMTFLDSYESKGTVYRNVISNSELNFNTADNATYFVTPYNGSSWNYFGDIKLNYEKSVGIIDMELITGDKLYFERFE